MKPLVIFDFDGVIANSEIIALAELQACLADYGLQFSREQLIDRFLGSSLNAITALLADHTGRDAESAFRASWYDRLFRRYQSELRPVEGILVLFDRLESAGLDYCIASGSSHQRLQFALRCIGLTDRFHDRAFSAEDVQCGKPEPDLMLFAAARRGARRQDCIVVEDATSGVLSARRAGMRAIGFVGGDHLAHDRDRQAARLMAAGTYAVAERHDQVLGWLLDALVPV
jgi:HAD superfamily hydrolase (TIGR01509 family)